MFNRMSLQCIYGSSQNCQGQQEKVAVQINHAETVVLPAQPQSQSEISLQ